MHRTFTAIAVAISCVVIATARPATAEEAAEVAPGLKIGDELNKTNWELAKDLLPPEVLQHYERGEYRNRVGSNPTEPHRWDDAFEAATEENAKNLDVDERGTIIDKRTGKQPPHYYGFPFPAIDPADPKAATKAVWNVFINYWNVGNSHDYALITSVNPTGIDREVLSDARFLYYDGQGPDLTPAENPLNLNMQSVTVVLKPVDLNGTAFLTWRYRDADKRDSVWTYVPALRRVRAVSPANRSDGILGSDLSQDDGHFFDGKPQDFTWKLVGKRDALRLADPNSMKAHLPLTPWKEGGWVIIGDERPGIGYRTPGWDGLAWAPTDPVLVKRPMWVVEGVPHDKYYLYGRLELWIDSTSWVGAWNRKFNWQGELVNTYQVMATRNHPTGPPQNQWVWNGTMVWQCAENFKANRATLAGTRPGPLDPIARRVPMKENIFDPQMLSRFGK